MDFLQRWLELIGCKPAKISHKPKKKTTFKLEADTQMISCLNTSRAIDGFNVSNPTIFLHLGHGSIKCFIDRKEKKNHWPSFLVRDTDVSSPR